MEEIEIDTAKLCNLVKERPVLWDRSCPEFTSRTITWRAWQEVTAALVESFEFSGDQESFVRRVHRKWKNLKDNFSKYEKKLMDEARSGKPLRKSSHYEELLSFLRKNFRNASSGNLDVTNNNSSSNSNDYVYLSQTQDNNISHRQDNNISHRQENNIPHRQDNNIPHRQLQLQDYTNINNTILIPDEEPEELPSKKFKIDQIDLKLLQSLDTPEERHIAFFKSILPTLTKLSNKETIQFQMDVLKILQNINKSRDYAMNYEAEPSTTIDI